jgi:hypothetical protein
MNVISRTPVSNTNAPDLSLFYTPIVSPANGKLICQVENPDPRSGKALGPYKEGSNDPQWVGPRVSLSCQPNGVLEARPEGADGAYEIVQIDAAGNVTFWPGQSKLGSPLYWSTCYKFLGSVDVPELPK